MPDVFTIAHISTYRGLKNPIFVQGPRLVGVAFREQTRVHYEIFSEVTVETGDRRDVCCGESGDGRDVSQVSEKAVSKTSERPVCPPFISSGFPCFRETCCWMSRAI